MTPLRPKATPRRLYISGKSPSIITSSLRVFKGLEVAFEDDANPPKATPEYIEPTPDGADWTDRSEALLASLPEPLREHERGKWCADLARLWGHGASGREAAEQAHAALAARINESERGRP